MSALAARIIMSSVIAFIMAAVLYTFEKAHFPYLIQAVDPDIFSWNLLLHVQSNAFFYWQADPLFQLISFFTDHSLNQSILISMLLCALLSAGISCLLEQAGCNPRRALGASLLGSLFFLLSFGLDPLLLQACCWTVWATVFFGAILSGTLTMLPACLFALFIGLRLMHSYQYGLVAFLLSFLLMRALHQQQEHDTTHTFRLLLSALIVLACVVYQSLHIPTAAGLDYPALARVVADDGLPGNIVPLAVSGPVIPFLNEDYLKTFLLPFGLCFLLATLLSLLLFSRRVALALSVPFGTSLCVLLDILTPPQVSAILPLATLERTMPFLFFVPVEPLLLFVSSLLLLWITLPLIVPSKRGVLPAFVILCIFLAPITAPQSEPDKVELRGIPEPERSLIISPSFATLRTYDRLSVPYPQEIKYRHAGKFVRNIQASDRNSSTARMLDKKVKTRWSTQQQGDEWLELRFNEPLELYGLWLDTGEYITDYPAGLQFSIPDGCAETDELSFALEPWPGELKFTEKGYAYFGGQSSVRVIFPKILHTSCLRIEQTGSRNFDWSVARLKLGFAENSGDETTH